jgi:hypothetical protein
VGARRSFPCSLAMHLQFTADSSPIHRRVQLLKRRPPDGRAGAQIGGMYLCSTLSCMHQMKRSTVANTKDEEVSLWPKETMEEVPTPLLTHCTLCWVLLSWQWLFFGCLSHGRAQRQHPRYVVWLSYHSLWDLGRCLFRHQGNQRCGQQERGRTR